MLTEVYLPSHVTGYNVMERTSVRFERCDGCSKEKRFSDVRTDRMVEAEVVGLCASSVFQESSVFQISNHL